MLIYSCHLTLYTYVETCQCSIMYPYEETHQLLIYLCDLIHTFGTSAYTVHAVPQISIRPS